jgi:hypothetical protein
LPYGKIPTSVKKFIEDQFFSYMENIYLQGKNVYPQGTNILPQGTNINPIWKIFIFLGKQLSIGKFFYPEGTLFFLRRK